jgi:O-antigen/teichoic acid export membrane protein
VLPEIDRTESGCQFTSALFSSLRQFLQRQSVQAVVGNLGWLLGARIGRLVLSTFIGFWVARYLGPVRFGLLSYCIAWVTLFGVLPGLGLEAVVKRRFISQPEEEATLLATTVGLRLGATMIAAACFASATWFWVAAGEERRLMTILCILLLDPLWSSWDHWFQAKLWARLSVMAQIGSLVVSAALRIVLIFLRAPVAAFAAAVVVESVVGGMLWVGLAKNKGLRFSWRNYSPTWGRKLLADSWPLMLSTLMVLIYMRIDLIMLRSMAGERAVGIYSAATRFSEMAYFLPVALASSFLPSLLRQRAAAPGQYEEALQRYFDLSAGCAYALTLPIMLAAPWLIRLAYGSAYQEAGPILAVHVWANVFVFLGVARGQFLVNESLTRFYLVATATGAAMNILLNLILIPRIGAMGAAVATVASYATASWISSYLHPAVRTTAARQTRALLLPITGWRYLSHP